MENSKEKIKTRHFAPKTKNHYAPPLYLGVFLALNGFPKILVETWGVGCSNLFFPERTRFHTQIIKTVFSYISKTSFHYSNFSEKQTTLKYKTLPKKEKAIKTFLKYLKIHQIKASIIKNEVIIHSSKNQIPFIKALYYYFVVKNGRV